jgi:hypothetical protein
MNTTTMHGKRRTTPKGIETLELPFKRIGRRKNASLDVILFFDPDCEESSFNGRAGTEGRRFSALLTTSIEAKLLCLVVRGAYEEKEEDVWRLAVQCLCLSINNPLYYNVYCTICLLNQIEAKWQREIGRR